jgi:hypothetical protein
LVRNDQGEFRGHVKIERIKPGCVQGHWPEVNVLVPAGCLDPSGVPDYNASSKLSRLVNKVHPRWQVRLQRIREAESCMR